MPAPSTGGIPYSWYLQNYVPTSFDESGRGIYQPYSEAEWNAMDRKYQEQGIFSPQGGNGINDQSLNERFYAAVGGKKPGYERGIGPVTPGTDPSKFVDQSRVWTDPQSGLQFTDAENYTPQAQNIDGGFFGERPWLSGIGFVLGAGLANNLATTGSLFTAPGEAGGALGGASGGPLANDPYGPYYNGSGTVDAGAFPGGVNDPYGPYYGPGGTVDAGSFPFSPNDPYGPYYDGNGWTDAGGTTPGTGIQTGTTPGGNSLLDTLRNGGSNLLTSAMNNPLQALGLLQAGSSIFGNNGGSKPPSSSGDSSKGGGGIPTTPYQRTPYQPNQVTQQQIRDFRPVGR